MLYPLSYGDRYSIFRFLPPSGDGSLSAVGGDPLFNRATGQMRKIFKFCGAPGFERFDWEEAKTFDPAALRRRTRASARPLLHYSRRRRNLSRRRGMYGGMPPAAQGEAGPLRGEAFPPPAGAPVDAASGRNGELLLPPAGMSAAASAFLAEAFPRRPSAGNSQSPFLCAGGAFRRGLCAAKRSRRRQEPPWTPLPAAAPHLRQGDVCRARGGPCDRGRRRRVGLRRLPERFAGKSFGGPAQRRRYISSRNSALRSSTFVSRGFPGRQASA